MRSFALTICLAALSVKTLAQEPILTECFQDVEFTLFKDELTPQQADESCSPGRLSAVRTSEEYLFLVDAISRANVTENFWLGLVAEESNIFVLAFPDISFSDGSRDGLEFVTEFNIPPWDRNIDAMLGTQCVFWRVEDNLWSVNSCSERKSFLCRTEGCSTTSPTMNPTSAPVVMPSPTTEKSLESAHLLSLEIYVISMISVGSMLLCSVAALIRFQRIESRITYHAIVLNAQNSIKEQLEKSFKSSTKSAFELKMSKV